MLRWIVAAALLAGAAWTGWRSFTAARTARAARGWTRVPATITESRINEVRTYDADNRPITVFEPKVTYAYEAAGARRTGRRIGLTDESFLARKEADTRLAAWPAGAEAEALVDPANPDRACLAARADLNLTAPLAFLVIAGITASGVLGV